MIGKVAQGHGKFYVTVCEVWEQVVEVEAGTYEEAKQFVEDGKGDYLDNPPEYSYTLEPEYWEVSVSKP